MGCIAGLVCLPVIKEDSSDRSLRVDFVHFINPVAYGLRSAHR